MDQGEEAGSADLKESPLDFALWKGEKEGEDTAWDSPWGRGRPGWHIECSAMAEAELGTTFEIHGGGSDLVFPHHENEIAQSEGARGEPLARIWMHNGMVLTGPEAKMAKSVGNVFLLHEALDRYGSEAIVDFLFSGHYRQPLAFGRGATGAGEGPHRAIPEFLSRASARRRAAMRSRRVRPERQSDFLDALADDFNTPRAMAELHDLVTEANKRPVSGASAALVELLDVLGLGSLADVRRRT